MTSFSEVDFICVPSCFQWREGRMSKQLLEFLVALSVQFQRGQQHPLRVHSLFSDLSC